MDHQEAINYETDRITKAEEILLRTYRKEMDTKGSPVTEALIQLNLEHSRRVYENAIKIAKKEGLDETELGIAAMLHDVSKLNSGEKSGIDTFHHHEHGFMAVGDILSKELGLDDEAVERISNAIHRHSDIPFIRRFLEKTGEEVPTPETKFDLALRDADTMDQLEAGGMHKIVHFRQNPASAFYKEDGGDIQKAIASAKKSFDEALGVMSTDTGKKMAAERAEKMKPFFERLKSAATLEEFDRIYEEFLIII